MKKQDEKISLLTRIIMLLLPKMSGSDHDAIRKRLSKGRGFSQKNILELKKAIFGEDM